MEFQTFHRYNKLAKQGLVKPLACYTCRTTYILRVTEDDEPVLQCLLCDALIQPGLRLYQEICAVVKEHYLD